VCDASSGLPYGARAASSSGCAPPTGSRRRPLPASPTWWSSNAGRTQPFASGATCAWPGLDLQVANPSSVAFRLGVEVTATHLVGSWATASPLAERYEVYEVDHRITADADGGHTRSNEMRRRVLRDGVVVGDELVARNRARVMYPVDDA
jgi:vancomycin resistance protein YoaR